MSVFLYIETNGIMSLAQKRNPAVIARKLT